jgi:hypothetical protein
MAAPGEKSFCVLEYHTIKSVVTVPPRSPDITPCDFFLWGYVKDRVFVPPLSRDLADLKARIIAAVKNIDAPMLTRVWQELEYRIDVCRATRDARIEHPYVSKKNFFQFSCGCEQFH